MGSDRGGRVQAVGSTPSSPVLFSCCARGVSFHQARIMLWINASATSGECPRIVAHSSFGSSLVILPTSP